MSGFGGGLLSELVAELLVKSVELAWDLIQGNNPFKEQSAEFNTRLEAQIGIWNAIGVKLQGIKDQVRPKDLITYYKVEKKAYHLLLKYVHAGSGGSLNAQQLSFEEKIQELEESSTFGENTKPGSGVSQWFYTMKKQVAYSLSGEKHHRKLVKEIKDWSRVLQELTNWTILPKLPQATRQDIMVYVVDPSGCLTDTNLWARIMLAKSGFDSTVLGITVGPEEPLLSSFRLPISDAVQVLPKGLITVQSESEYTIDTKASSHEIKVQLGGSTLRQWAVLNTQSYSRLVIIEFCPKSAPAPFMKLEEIQSLQIPSTNSPMRTSPNKLDQLVEMLRMAVYDSKSFRVLYTRG